MKAVGGGHVLTGDRHLGNAFVNGGELFTQPGGKARAACAEFQNSDCGLAARATSDLRKRMGPFQRVMGRRVEDEIVRNGAVVGLHSRFELIELMSCNPA